MSKPNTHLDEFFTEHHRACDEAWVEVEAAASDKDLARVKETWVKFANMTRLHFRWEEEIMFPAFEDATGMRGVGPTMVMRHEHAQVRSLLDHMQTEVDGGDLGGLLDDGDTLLMLIQQHNAKEEGMLYPMAERALADRWPDLAAHLPDR